VEAQPDGWELDLEILASEAPREGRSSGTRDGVHST
jgi:hypothetical protein